MAKIRTGVDGPRTIIAASGGSGGHWYPAIAFLAAVKKAHPDWRLLMTVDDEEKRLRLAKELEGIAQVLTVVSHPIRGVKSLIRPAFWSAVLKGVGQARQAVEKYRPDAVVGFGGFGSFPMVWKAAGLNVPTVIHEQNAFMGKANRMLADKVSRVALTYDETLPVSSAKRRIVTGFPLRSGIKRSDQAESLRSLGMDPAKKTLLVFGGSQGSAFINRVFEEMINTYGEALKKDWQFLHLTGRSKMSASKINAEVGWIKQWEYFEDMALLYSASDCVVCRAGAATLHELAFFHLPAVLVPYPHASGHQRLNAEPLSRAGAAWVRDEKEWNAEKWKCFLEQSAANRDFLTKMAESYKETLHIDGAERLRELVESLCHP